MLEVVSCYVEVPKNAYDNIVSISEETGVTPEDLMAGAIAVAFSKPKATLLSKIVKVTSDWKIDRIIHKYAAARKPKGEVTQE